MLFPLSCVCPALVASCWVHSAALGLCGQQGAVQTAYAIPWERLESAAQTPAPPSSSSESQEKQVSCSDGSPCLRKARNVLNLCSSRYVPPQGRLCLHTVLFTLLFSIIQALKGVLRMLFKSWVTYVDVRVSAGLVSVVPGAQT